MKYFREPFFVEQIYFLVAAEGRAKLIRVKKQMVSIQVIYGSVLNFALWF